MAKFVSRLLVFASVGLLLSCGNNESSSSISSQSSSSSSEVVYPYTRYNGLGQLNVGFDWPNGNVTSHFGVSLQDFSLDFSLNQIPTVTGDLFDPSFQSSFRLGGVLKFASIEVSETIGKISNVYRFAASEVPLYLTKGNLYIDCSNFDIASLMADFKLEVPSKFYIENIFSYLNQIDPGFSLPLSDLPSYLIGALSDESLESFISLSPYDHDNLNIGFAINKESISAFAKLVSEGQNIDDALKALPEFQDSELGIRYNLKKEEITGAGFNLATKLDFSEQLKAIPVIDIATNYQMDILGTDLIKEVENTESYTKLDIDKLVEAIKSRTSQEGE